MVGALFILFLLGLLALVAGAGCGVLLILFWLLAKQRFPVWTAITQWLFIGGAATMVLSYSTCMTMKINL